MATKNIIITTDLSDSSACGLRYGDIHAKQLGTDGDDAIKIFALYIAPPFELPIVLQKQLSDSANLKAMKESYEENEQKKIQEFIDKLNLSSEVTPVVIFSDRAPSIEILEYIEKKEAALIIIASQGKGALGRLLLGSTTQRVVTAAKCPVLIVPAKPIKEKGV